MANVRNEAASSSTDREFWQDIVSAIPLISGLFPIACDGETEMVMLFTLI